jgi:ribosomal protein L29
MAGKKQKETKEKPLEKMTATELRELAKGIEGVTGVHGMNKPELISAVKKARGIVEAKGKSADGSVRAIKQKLRALRVQRKAMDDADPGRLQILRRRISRLKKKTRRAS